MKVSKLYGIIRPLSIYARGILKKVFTLITRQMFSVRTMPEEFKNPTITRCFGFLFEENSVREIACIIIATSSFSKSFVFHTFFVYTETEFSNSSYSKNLSKKRRFSDGLLWVVEIKSR